MGSSAGQKTSNIVHKIWSLESAETRTVEVPEYGFDYSLIGKLKEGEQFNARYYDGKIYDLIHKEGKIYNLATGLEL